MRVHVTATGSVVNPRKLEAGVHRLEADGYDVFVDPQCHLHERFWAGSDEERAAAFMRAARDPSVEIVWAARGGYGTARMIPLLSDDGVTGPKTLIGYSDVTPLLALVHERWGWRAIHGPVVTSDPSLEIRREVRSVLAGGRGEAWPTLEWWTEPADVQGPLVGGNLALLSSVCGTPRQMSARGKLVLMEDVHEPLYRVDRMLTQLRQSGALDGALAVVLGQFTRVEDEDNPDRERLETDATLRAMFGDLGLPVAAGLPIGHVAENRPIELFVPYRLAADGAFSRT